MPRSLKKGPFIDAKLEKKVNEQGKKIENISLYEMDQIWDNIKRDELV